MIPIVYSLEEARKFFLHHSTGNVLCVREDGEELEVDCYLAAEEFFED